VTQHKNPKPDIRNPELRNPISETRNSAGHTTSTRRTATSSSLAAARTLAQAFPTSSSQRASASSASSCTAQVTRRSRRWVLLASPRRSRGWCSCSTSRPRASPSGVGVEDRWFPFVSGIWGWVLGCRVCTAVLVRGCGCMPAKLQLTLGVDTHRIWRTYVSRTHTYTTRMHTYTTRIHTHTTPNALVHASLPCVASLQYESHT